MRVSQEKQLAALAKVARSVLQQFYRNDCCVAATRVGVTLLESWGFRNVKPILTRAIACNTQWVQGLREVPAHIVTVDVDSPGPGIAGHLCLTGKIGSQKFLLDLSAFQLNRPSKGILVPEAMMVELSKPLVGDWGVQVDLYDGGRLFWGAHPRPEKVPWSSASDWVMPKTRQRVVHDDVAVLLDQHYASRT